MTTDEEAPDAARLERWQLAGGTFEVLSLTETTATISLMTCDGGEEADRFTTAEPGLLARLRGPTEA